MSNKSFSFYNYSTADIVLTTTDGTDVKIASDSKVDDTSEKGDYTITYGSKKFKITRDDINKLADHSYYYFFITDSIVLGDPVSKSTYTHGTSVNKISDRPSTTWSVFISPSQNITITNGSPDGTWVQFDSSSGISMIWIILLIIFIIVCVIVGGASGYYYWKKKHE